MKAVAKNENQLAYVSFSQLLKEISLNGKLKPLNVAGSAQHHQSKEAQLEQVGNNIEKSFFKEALMHWCGNISNEDYIEYSTSLLQLSKDYACVVYNEEKIASVLLEALSHLTQDQPLQAVLDLVVQFANDIQSDMLNYVPEIFVAIVHLLDCNSAIVIESSFIAVACIFKMFSTAFMNNIDLFLLWHKMIFSKYSSMKSVKMENIIRFCCESSTFVVRKLLGSCADNNKQIQSLFKMLLIKLGEPLKMIKNDPTNNSRNIINIDIQLDADTVAQSFGLLLATLCKLSGKHLYSKHQIILDNCWSVCLLRGGGGGYSSDTMRLALQICLSNLASYTKSNTNTNAIVRIVCDWASQLPTAHDNATAIVFYFNAIEEFVSNTKARDGALMLQFNLNDVIAAVGDNNSGGSCFYLDDLLNTIKVILEKSSICPDKQSQWFVTLINSIAGVVSSGELVHLFTFISSYTSAECMFHVLNSHINRSICNREEDTRNLNLNLNHVFACAKIALLNIYNNQSKEASVIVPMFDYSFLVANASNGNYSLNVPMVNLISLPFVNHQVNPLISKIDQQRYLHFECEYLLCLPYIAAQLAHNEVKQIHDSLIHHLDTFKGYLIGDQLEVEAHAPLVPLLLLNACLLERMLQQDNSTIHTLCSSRLFSQNDLIHFYALNSHYALITLFVITSVFDHHHLSMSTPTYIHFEFDAIFDLVKFNLLHFYGNEQWMTLRILQTLASSDGDVESSSLEQTTKKRECLKQLSLIDTHAISFSNYRQHYATISKLIIKFVNHGCHEILLYYLCAHFQTNISLLWKPAVELITEMNNKWYVDRTGDRISKYVWPLARESMLSYNNNNNTPNEWQSNNKPTNKLLQSGEGVIDDNEFYNELKNNRHINPQLIITSNRDSQVNFLKHIWIVFDEVIKTTPKSIDFIDFFVQCVSRMSFSSGANPHASNTLAVGVDVVGVNTTSSDLALQSLLCVLSKETTENLNTFNTKSNAAFEQLILHLIKYPSANTQQTALNVLFKLNSYHCLRENLESICYWINLKGDVSSYKDVFLSLFAGIDSTVTGTTNIVGDIRDERDFPITPFTHDTVPTALPVVINLLIGIFKRHGNNSVFLKGLLREALIVFQKISSLYIDHYLRDVLVSLFPMKQTKIITAAEVHSIFIPSAVLMQCSVLSSELNTHTRCLETNHFIPIHLMNIFVNSCVLMIDNFKLNSNAVEMLLEGSAFVIDQTDYLLTELADEQHPCGHLFKRPKLKNLRKNTFNLLCKLFANYSEFDFRRYENLVKDVFVVPNVEAMLTGSFFEPTHLLQLVSIWCNNSPYIHYMNTPVPSNLLTNDTLLNNDNLLNVYNGSENINLLDAVLSIWNCQKISTKTRITMATIVHQIIQIGSTQANFFPCGKVTLEGLSKKAVNFLSGVIVNSGKTNGKLLENVELNLLLKVISLEVVDVCSEEALILLNFCVNTATSKGFNNKSEKHNALETQSITAVVGLLPPSSSSSNNNLIVHKTIIKMDELLYRLVGLFYSLKMSSNEIKLVDSLVTKGYLPPTLLAIVKEMNSVDMMGECESPDSVIRKQCLYRIEQMVTQDDMGFGHDHCDRNTRSISILIIAVKVLKHLNEAVAYPILKDITLTTIDILLKCIHSNITTNDPILTPIVTCATLNRILYKHMSSGFVDSDEKTRSTMCSLLQLCCARQHQQQSGGYDLHPLRFLSNNNDSHNNTNDDIEVNFFHNIFHIQTHRRQRAITQLIKLVLNDQITMPDSLLEKIMLQLILGFVYDANNHTSKNHAVLDEAIVAIGAISKRLKWKKYTKLIYRFMSPLKLHNSDEIFGASTANDKVVIKLQKFNLRMLDAILSNFHFTITDATTSNINMNIDNDADSASVKDISKVTFDDVAKLIPDLLSKLYTQTYTSKARYSSENFADIHECIVRAPFAVVIARFLKALPARVMHIHLRGLILHLLGLLKSRHSNLRDISREVFVKLIDVVGPECFPLVITEMNTILNKGYQKSVAYFSVHFLLCHLSSAFLTDAQTLVNAKTVAIILKWVRDDLFSRKHSSKDQVNMLTTQKFKECCLSKSYDTLVILGSITPKDYLVEFVNAFKIIIARASNYETINKLNKIYEMIVAGFMKNNQVTNDQWITFALTIYNDSTLNTNNNNSSNDDANKNHSKLILKEMVTAVIDDKTKAELISTSQLGTNYVLHMFILHMFTFVVKRAIGGVDINVGLLDSLVDPTLSCLRSSSTEILFKGINVLGLLLKLQLPSISSSITMVTELVFQIMTKYSSCALSTVNKELAIAVFKVMSTLVSKYETHLNKDMFRILIIQCERHISDSNNVNSGVFSLLKCIMRNGFVCNEFYTLIEKLKTLSVVSDSDDVRSQCGNMIKLFFTNYNSKDQLNLFVAYYLGNLNYEKHTGRLSSLELLHFIIEHVKTTQLESLINELFLNLSLLLKNDDSMLCRTKASETLSILLTKLDNKQRSKLFQIAILWLNHNQTSNSIVQMGCLLMNIFKGVEKNEFNTRVSSVFTHTNDTLNKLIVQCDALDTDITLFKLLHLIDFLVRNTALDVLKMSMGTLRAIYQMVVSNCLKHSHIWARQLANDMVCFDLYLTSPDKLAVSYIDKKSSIKHSQDMFYCPKSFDEIIKLTKLILKQLKSPLSTAQQDESALKNLIFISRTVLLCDPPPPHSTLNTMRDKTPSLFLEFGDKSQLLMSNFIEGVFFKMLSYANTEVSLSNKETSTSSKRINVLKWVAAVVSFGKEHEKLNSPLFSERLMVKVFNFIKRENTNIEQLNVYCEEVTLLLKSCFGNIQFIELQENAEKQLADRKNRKRSATALQAVANPTLFAIRKMKIKQRKRLKKSKF